MIGLRPPRLACVSFWRYRRARSAAAEHSGAGTRERDVACVGLEERLASENRRAVSIHAAPVQFWAAICITATATHIEPHTSVGHAVGQAWPGWSRRISFGIFVAMRRWLQGWVLDCSGSTLARW